MAFLPCFDHGFCQIKILWSFYLISTMGFVRFGFRRLENVGCESDTASQHGKKLTVNLFELVSASQNQKMIAVNLPRLQSMKKVDCEFI
jgi:hypothetical protein